MSEKELWNVFFLTGKIADYINYKNHSAALMPEGERISEVHDRRIDNKGNQCR